MLYHKTRNLVYVQQQLGHRYIQNTMIYTQLITFGGDEYHSAVASTVEEARKLADAGFDYFTTIQGVQVFRKRK